MIRLLPHWRRGIALAAIYALMLQAFAALRVSPGARAFYDAQRASGRQHNEALRRLASRLVGILHGCLKTRTCYHEATAWGHAPAGVTVLGHVGQGLGDHEIPGKHPSI